MKKPKALTKAERRERQRPRMKIQGASVKKLQRIIVDRGRRAASR